VSLETKIGKIKSMRFGLHCGRSDSLLGVHFEFDGPGWGVQSQSVLCTASEWDFDRETDKDEPKAVDVDKVRSGEVLNLIRIMRDAKVRDVMKLVGTPVEVTFEHTWLKSWRVLTEVL
jgi:hypothetical protein